MAIVSSPTWIECASLDAALRAPDLVPGPQGYPGATRALSRAQVGPSSSWG
jgi:hypothetical protein